MNPIDRYLVIARSKSYDNVSVPPDKKGRFKGVSVGKDKQGFFCYTHRARSKSRPTIDAIPDKDIAFIESTG